MIFSTQAFALSFVEKLIITIWERALKCSLQAELGAIAKVQGLRRALERVKAASSNGMLTAAGMKADDAMRQAVKLAASVSRLERDLAAVGASHAGQRQKFADASLTLSVTLGDLEKNVRRSRAGRPS
jgi:hypothetical protein